MNTLSSQRPLPSMLIFTPASFSTPVNPSPVNWLPWSVLNISGLPYFANASANASTQKSASMVLLRRQLSSFLECQSSTATKYMKPLRIGM